MEVIIRPDAEAASEVAAHVIAAELQRRPNMVLGLATGRTMESVYAHLVSHHRSDALDFSRCATFNLDEYVGLGPDHPSSYRAYMEQHLFRHVNIDRRRTHLPDGLAQDTAEEGARYEALIRDHGGIGLQLLGIGETGHIGFNEPGSALTSRTRAKTLALGTRRQNAEMFGGDPDLVPHRAMTMGVQTILDAEHLLLVATGRKKASIVAQALEGPLTAMVTGSALQLHPRCTIILDEAAAGALGARDYYDEAASQDPGWTKLLGARAPDRRMAG